MHKLAYNLGEKFGQGPKHTGNPPTMLSQKEAGPHLSIDKNNPFSSGGAMSELDPINAVAQRHLPHGHHISA